MTKTWTGNEKGKVANEEMLPRNDMIIFPGWENEQKNENQKWGLKWDKRNQQAEDYDNLAEIKIKEWAKEGGVSAGRKQILRSWRQVTLTMKKYEMKKRKNIIYIYLSHITLCNTVKCKEQKRSTWGQRWKARLPSPWHPSCFEGSGQTGAEGQTEENTGRRPDCAFPTLVIRNIFAMQEMTEVTLCLHHLADRQGCAEEAGETEAETKSSPYYQCFL